MRNGPREQPEQQRSTTRLEHTHGAVACLRLFAFCLAEKVAQCDEKTRHKCVKLMTSLKRGRGGGREGRRQERGRKKETAAEAEEEATQLEKQTVWREKQGKAGLEGTQRGRGQGLSRRGNRRGGRRGDTLTARFGSLHHI